MFSNKTMLQLVASDNGWLFSNEATFHFPGKVNEQNVRTLG
jgi:hypothetical protein